MALKVMMNFSIYLTAHIVFQNVGHAEIITTEDIVFIYNVKMELIYQKHLDVSNN